MTRSVTTMFFFYSHMLHSKYALILFFAGDITLLDKALNAKYHYHHINYTRFRRTNRTLTSRSESRNLSWRFVSMCNWFPASLSACSLLLGMAVWSLGANSMSISTSCQEPKESWFERALHDIIHVLSDVWQMRAGNHSEGQKWDPEVRTSGLALLFCPAHST